ncbi:DUF2141 domain-containing protein [Sphingomonas gilva]|uniref:DUF2141 domain-containing protein n=2 Tax=Sphingomonas gilva TaxID=2305907 RepID=A0A396RRE4_9SPHN|nr:DUF2141 domain-containing protein [Sphingomonas gilva]
MALALPTAAPAAILGADAAACQNGGPAILANITGLKDRKGIVRLELYPDNAEDFLQDDYILEQAGKTFRRVDAKIPSSGTVSLCIKVPKAGRYTLMFLHDRDSNGKFGAFSDGAGFPGNTKLGRRKPPANIAMINVSGVTRTHIRAQYLRGLSGFGPLN